MLDGPELFLELRLQTLYRARLATFMKVPFFPRIREFHALGEESNLNFY